MQKLGALLIVGLSSSVMSTKQRKQATATAARNEKGCQTSVHVLILGSHLMRGQQYYVSFDSQVYITRIAARRARFEIKCLLSSFALVIGLVSCFRSQSLMASRS